MSITTIVSCFYLLDKSKHKELNYVLWMINFFKIKTPKIIFTDKKTFDKLFISINQPSIKFIIYEIEEFFVSSLLNKNQWNKQHENDNEWYIHNPNLYKIWNEKTEMLKKAINSNYFNSDFFLWCDVGCFRENNTINKFINWPNKEKLELYKKKLTVLNIDNFLFEELNSKSLVDFSKKNRIGGGIFGGHKEVCLKWHEEYYNMFNKFIQNSVFLGKDQSIMANIHIKSLQSNDNFINCVELPDKYKNKQERWFYLQEYFL